MLFVIRKEHREAFEQAARESCEERLIAHAERVWPKRVRQLGAERTEAFVRAGIRRAAEYELARERDIARFIDLMFALGPRFDRRVRWARGILQSGVLRPHEKVERLCARLRNELATRADATMDGS